MFHVEQMKNINFLSLLCIILVSGASCTKRINNPELNDVIYTELTKELSLSVKQETDLVKQLEKDTLIYKKTVPQEGNSTTNRNKMNTTENLLDIIRQQKKFFEIKIEQRKNYVQERYNESLRKDGRPWPDEKEEQDYKIRLKLQRDKFSWDSQNVPRGTNKEELKKNETKNQKNSGENHDSK